MTEEPSGVTAQTPLAYPKCPSYISRPYGQVAQLVEQRTENPRVGGSIPSLAIPYNPLRQHNLTTRRPPSVGGRFYA